MLGIVVADTGPLRCLILIGRIWYQMRPAGTVAATAGDSHTARVSLIHNESTKLLANALDRASTACFAIGALAPAVAVYGSNAEPLLGVLVTTTVWILVAVALHLLAQRVLKGLRP